MKNKILLLLVMLSAQSLNAHSESILSAQEAHEQGPETVVYMEFTQEEIDQAAEEYFLEVMRIQQEAQQRMLVELEAIRSLSEQN